MVRPIGDLVSHCFYGGELQSVREADSSSLAPTLPKPVTWFDTGELSHRREVRDHGSYKNVAEVEHICTVLKHLNFLARVRGTRYDVAVLSGYASQKLEIGRALNREHQELESLTLECNTVDAFQGRETDIAIYSVTRSNGRGDLGFLRERRRLNVALSRARIGLGIVGDAGFLRSAPGYNPVDQGAGLYGNASRRLCLRGGFMTSEETADRFDNRAGYKLIAYGPVGLPLYRLTTVGLCVGKKSLDPIHEFVLRGVMAGTQWVEDAAGLLGLDTSVVESCLAELVRTESVSVRTGNAAGRRQVELTAKGRDLARDQESTVPVEQTVVFCVDGLTRAPRFYPFESLDKPRDLRDKGGTGGPGVSRPRTSSVPGITPINSTGYGDLH